jgi:cyclic-di-GMP-binding protein
MTAMYDPPITVPPDAPSQDRGAVRGPERAPALAFRNAEGAARWAKALPLMNVALAFEALFGQLGALAAAELPPRERATIAEVLREPVEHLHTELARRYAGKPQPAASRELEAAEQAIALWQALWQQYSACLKPLLEGDPELAGVKPKVLQRGLFVGKQLVVVYGLARRVPPPTLWSELHAYYRIAELLECASTAITDDLIQPGGEVSSYSTYSHALLLGLADPCAMSVKQVELADRWLGMWARKVFPYVRQRDTEGPVIVIDLDGTAGAVLSTKLPSDPPSSMRFGYPGKLATSVRGRLKHLQNGASPAELRLGQDCSADQCTTLLGYLDARWHRTPRLVPDRSAPPSTLELCGGGVDAAYFRVGGRSFERKDPMERLSFRDAQHLKVLGTVTDYDRGRDDAERAWAWEPWRGDCGPREAALTRPADAGERWSLDQLVVVRGGDPAGMRIGYVTRVALDTDGTLAMSLRLWAGTPRAMSLRPQAVPPAEEPPLPALLMPETPSDKACLVLPPRTFTPGRVLRSADPGSDRRFRLARLLKRGVDFERVAFDEAT